MIRTNTGRRRDDRKRIWLPGINTYNTFVKPSVKKREEERVCECQSSSIDGCKEEEWWDMISVCFGQQIQRMCYERGLQ